MWRYGFTPEARHETEIKLKRNYTTRGKPGCYRLASHSVTFIPPDREHQHPSAFSHLSVQRRHAASCYRLQPFPPTPPPFDPPPPLKLPSYQRSAGLYRWFSCYLLQHSRAATQHLQHALGFRHLHHGINTSGGLFKYTFSTDGARSDTSESSDLILFALFTSFAWGTKLSTFSQNNAVNSLNRH